MYEKLKNLKHGLPSLKPNYKLIPCSIVTKDEFNSYYEWLKQQSWATIVRTPSRGISIKRFAVPCWDISTSNYVLELTIITADGQWRLQYRADKSKNMFGSQAFRKFQQLCKKFGIDLNNYKIDNGAEVKTQIEKYIVKLEASHVKNLTFTNAHHIDYHSSFPLGLVNTHPEFKPIIEYLYNKRKVDETCKQILNYTIGFMQSIGGCKAQWAHLSRDAIADNNKRIRDLANTLRESGRTILAYNTDGIWYTGEIYHADNEGPEFGQWANDHTNCTIRFKSAGSYEYIENDIYTPVVRGQTKLEDPHYEHYKPREEWKWGDIYGAGSQIKFNYFTEKDGIVEIYKNNEEDNEIW